ncbi:MAG: DUF1573 domain-containing protein [Bacteroidota bacterium]
MKISFSYILLIALFSITIWNCGNETSEQTADTSVAQSTVAPQPAEVPDETPKPAPVATKEEPLEIAVPKAEMPTKEKASPKEPAAAPTETKAATTSKKTAAAPKPKPRKKLPKIRFNETMHEFGLINQGEEITYKFEFVNTGEEELLISNVTATCGCTQPSYPFIPIAPGDKGYIGVTYNSKGKLGAQKPTLTVYTNANPKTYKLYLQGVVDAPRAPEATPEEKAGNSGSN